MALRYWLIVIGYWNLNIALFNKFTVWKV